MSQFELQTSPAGNMSKQAANLSVFIITKNEERNIAECLKSVSFAGEVIVVDTGSTDKTVQIARDHGVRVECAVWEGFGLSKGRALKYATGDWVLSLDADERVSAELAGEIQKATEQNAIVGFEIPRLTNFVGSWIRHSGWYPDYVLRLFKRERGRFSPAQVHEQVILSGQLGRLKHHLLHYSYRSIEDYVSRMNRYTSLAARELFDKNEPFSQWQSIWQPLLKPFAVIFKRYIIKLGFLDGWAGVQIALLSGMYVFLKYSKLRQLERDRPVDMIVK